MTAKPFLDVAAESTLHDSLFETLVSGNVRTVFLQMPNWQWGKSVPIFPPLVSKASKIIVPLSGWVAYVDSIVPAGHDFKLVEGNNSGHIASGTPHVMLFGPQAVVQVTTWGLHEDKALDPESPFWKVFDGFSAQDLVSARDRQGRARHSGTHTG